MSLPNAIVAATTESKNTISAWPTTVSPHNKMNTLTAFLLVAPALVLMAGAFSLQRTQRSVKCPGSDVEFNVMLVTCAHSRLDANNVTDTYFFCSAMGIIDECFAYMLDTCSDTNWLPENRDKIDDDLKRFKLIMLPGCYESEDED